MIYARTTDQGIEVTRDDGFVPTLVDTALVDCGQRHDLRSVIDTRADAGYALDQMRLSCLSRLRDERNIEGRSIQSDRMMLPTSSEHSIEAFDVEHVFTAHFAHRSRVPMTDASLRSSDVAPHLAS